MMLLGCLMQTTVQRAKASSTVVALLRKNLLRNDRPSTGSGFHLSLRHAHIGLGGIFPPVVTPFTDDASIAYDELEQNFSKWNKIPFRGYLIHGSNGEYTSLSRGERIEMVQHVRRLVPKNRLLLVGSGLESTSATIESTKEMAAAGADCVVVVTPCFFKNRLTADALKQHYTKVAEASPVPVILYSVPANTGIDLPVEVIVDLSTHPNIIGLKDSGGDVTKLGQILAQVDSSTFQVLAGSAGFILPAYSIGCVGAICALANVLGNELCHLHDLIRQGKWKDATALQLQLIKPNIAVTKQFGVAGLKSIMERRGFYGGHPRLPLLPLAETEIKILERTFAAGGFLNNNSREQQL